MSRHLWLLGTLAVAAPMLNGCGRAGVGEPRAAVTPGATVWRPAGHAARHRRRAPFRFFSSSSFWNVPVASSATLDPNSAGLVNELAATVTAEEQAKEGPWINTTSYSIPLYTVPATQPTVKVTLENATTAPALQAAWTAVPLPAEAHPATGTDGVLALWQPSTNKLWDFWRLVQKTDGWHASWGGAMQNVTSNPGVYGPEAWPGAQNWWGDSASSLEPLGGLISLEDLERNLINHALAIAIPNVRAGVYASPAKRDDGKSTNPLSLPEGAHLRLNPNLNIPNLHLPHTTQLIAEAAQRYGIYIRDGARNITFYAQDPTPTKTNPYTGPTGYFEGQHPSKLLATFPWKELQVLKMRLHRNRFRRHGPFSRMDASLDARR
jgi:hypothetical protein